MKVSVDYIDHNSSTVEEAKALAKSAVGSSAAVSVSPDSDTEYSKIFFILQEQYASDIQTIVLDYSPNIQGRKLEAKKEEVLDTISNVFDDLVAYIEDNK